MKGQTGKAHFSISPPQTITSQINHKGGREGKGEDYSLKCLMPEITAGFFSEANTKATVNFLYAPTFSCQSFHLSSDWSSDLCNNFSKFALSLFVSWKAKVEDYLKVFF